MMVHVFLIYTYLYLLCLLYIYLLYVTRHIYILHPFLTLHGKTICAFLLESGIRVI